MKMTKKVLSILLSLMLVLGTVAVGGISALADGYVYEISSYSDLMAFASRVNSGETSACAKLMYDIVATGYNWTPIGMDNNHIYTGTFDGNGRVITGLSNSGVPDAPNYAGLFGYVGTKTEGGVTTKGTVKNVGVEGGSITGNNYAGGVAGYNNGGTVTSCYNTGDVSGNNSVGGVVGHNYNNGTVSNCYNTGAVSGNNFVGGVVGHNYSSCTVSNCYNTGNVSGNNSVGGVAGQSFDNSKVSNCYNTGSVTATEDSTYVGGVVGRNVNKCTVENCYNMGDISGSKNVGGVAGHIFDNSKVSNCYNTGAVSGNNFVGGVTGDYNNSSVENCYYDSDILSGVSAIGDDNAASNNVRGLTTAQMTGANALDNMIFEYGDGEISPWQTKANGADVSGKYYLFYPHLKGFDYDLTAASEDWPARLEITVSTTEFTYTGAPEHPLKEDIIIVSGSMDIPDEFADKTVTYSRWDEELSEWKEILDSSVENPGRYKVTVTRPDETEILFERSFTVLETGDIRVTTSAVNGNTSVTGADAGDYEAKIQFAKYGNIEITVPYKINPADAEISVTAEDANCGETVKATVTASAGIGNNFTVTLEKQKNADEWEEVDALPSGITNGTQFEISGLSAGDYRLTASYDGGNYKACSASDEFSVNTLDPGMELTISPEQPVWGDDITITANLPESATGTVTFRLDEADTGVEVAVENGKAVYAIEGKSIEVGDYTVLASYSGDKRYNSVSEELPLAVNKAETEVHITVEPENPLSGQDVSITATVDGDAKIINFSEHGSTSLGGATLFIDGGVIYSLASETDTVTFNVPGLDAGEHTIKVVYNGDEHYWSAEGETTIFVGRSEPEIAVTAEDITYGEAVQATITVPGNATGNITAGLLKYGGIDPDTNEEIWNAVNGAPASITSGEQFEISGLAAGDYKLTVSLGEDSNYFSGSAEKAFKVNKAEPDMSVTVTPQNPASDGTFTLTVNLPDDATGNVIIGFNEVDLLGYIKLAEGNSQQFECLQAGTYHGTAKYLPADGSNYAEKEITFEFNVSAAAPNMTLTAEDITYGETATVTANLPTDTMWGSVTFFLDNADTGKEVYVSQGKAVCTFSGLKAGEHTVEAVFANDDKYADETKNVTFNVAQKALTITAEDQTYPFNGQIQGEGNTAYEGPGEKVTVDGLIAGDYLASIILDGQAKDIGEYPDSVVPSSAQIKNGNGQDVTTNYNITYTSGKFTITSVNAPLTVNYVYAQGGEAAEIHTEDVEIFTGYSVTSPAITGYTPDKETVEGTMENLDGVTETVTYTAIEYTATFVDENGETVGEVKFTVETETLDEPEVPEKEGYEGKWSEYTLAASDIEISVEYTVIEYTATFVDENGETVAQVPYTVETESIEAPAVPEKEGFTGEWEEYELTPGGITVNAVYTEIITENLCPLDKDDHGDGFFGRVLTFLHTLIWKAFRLLGLDVYFKIS